MNIKNILLTIAVSVAVVIASVSIIGSGKQGFQGVQGQKGDRGEQGVRGLQGEKGEKGERGERGLAGVNGISTKLGALSSPDLPYTYIGVGGVRRYSAKTESLSQATTTICSLQSPTATSSLVSGAITLTTSSTTATVLVMAKSSLTAASTTQIGTNFAIAANAQATAVATTTATNGIIFSPSQYLNFSLSGGTGTFSPAGVCQATWEAI